MAESAAIHRISGLAAEAFPTCAAATQAILRLVRELTGLRSRFLTRTNQGVFEVVAVAEGDGGPFAAGDSLPFQDLYCGHVITSLEPLVIEDTRQTEPYASLQITHDRDIGSYFGIPIVFSTGEVYGTLCAIDPERHYFEAQDVEVLVILARLLAHHLETDLLRQRTATELERARDIQQNLLPEGVPAMRTFDFAARCVAGSQVGGEFYDWMELLPGVFMLTVGDAKDHGLPAAIVATAVRAALRAVTPTLAPASTLAQIDRALSADLARSRGYISVFHGRINTLTGTLLYADCGQGNAFVLRANGEVTELDTGNLPLGVLPGQFYQAGKVNLAPGDTLVILSNGFVTRTGDALPVHAKLTEAIAAAPSAAAAVDALFALSGAVDDDRTALVLRRLPGLSVSDHVPADPLEGRV